LKNSSDKNGVLLPPYLNNTDPLELEDTPLQLALITMEVARLREQLTALARQLTTAAAMINPDSFEETGLG
jgi:hypothetical protein